MSGTISVWLSQLIRGTLVIMLQFDMFNKFSHTSVCFDLSVFSLKTVILGFGTFKHFLASKNALKKAHSFSHSSSQTHGRNVKEAWVTKSSLTTNTHTHTSEWKLSGWTLHKTAEVGRGSCKERSFRMSEEESWTPHPHDSSSHCGFNGYCFQNELRTSSSFHFIDWARVSVKW